MRSKTPCGDRFPEIVAALREAVRSDEDIVEFVMENELIPKDKLGESLIVLAQGWALAGAGDKTVFFDTQGIRRGAYAEVVLPRELIIAEAVIGFRQIQAKIERSTRISEPRKEAETSEEVLDELMDDMSKPPFSPFLLHPIGYRAPNPSAKFIEVFFLEECIKNNVPGVFMTVKEEGRGNINIMNNRVSLRAMYPTLEAAVDAYMEIVMTGVL